MSTKLTVTIERSVIENAKEYAKSQGRSLSNIIEEYLKSISGFETKPEELELSPITKSLFGSVNVKETDLDYEQILGDAILEKHLK